MNWRTLAERIGLTLVVIVGGTLCGGFLGSLYARLSSTGGWDALGMVLGGLAIGCVVGLAIGIYLAVRLDDETRRKTLLYTFVFDLLAIAILAATDFLD